MSLVTYGLGAGGGGGGGIFLMRAYRALSPGYVYWESPNAPDPTAIHAPYPLGELADILVATVYVATV